MTRHPKTLPRRAGAASFRPRRRRQCGAPKRFLPRGRRRRCLCADAGEYRDDGAQARACSSAETERRATLARFRALAELGIFLHIGSLAIRLDGTRVANRSYLIDPEEIAARYDKLHLFDVDLLG
jgi:hypothetical protein